VTHGTLRATRAAKAAAVILTAVSCSVYDASLLGSGPADAGSAGTPSSAGHSGTAGDENTDAGRGGSAGAAKGGSSGASAGDAGMIDMAGALETGGETSEGGTAGTGGSLGTAGSAGKAGGSSGGTAGASTAGGGSGGSGGSGATVGAGGSAGSGGTAGAGGSPPASGCAKLSVPLDDAGDRAHFVISLASAIDLSSATTGIISMRLYVQAGAAGTIFNYVQDGAPNYHYFGVTTASRPLLKSVSGWQTLTFNVGAQAAGSTGIVKTDIRRIGIEINAAPDTTGWSNPTIVYIDSVTVMTPALSFPLDMTATVISTPTGSDPSNQAMWLHNGSSDTTATNPTLTWQATCP